MAGLLPLLLTAQRECTMFKKEYCNMQVGFIIIIIFVITIIISTMFKKEYCTMQVGVISIIIIICIIVNTIIFIIRNN